MPTPENPIITEHPEGPNFSENLTQQTGVQPVPTQVKPVFDNQGNPLISTPTSQSAKIQIPGNRQTLLAKARGSITDAATWLARFFLRIIAKQNTDATND